MRDETHRTGLTLGALCRKNEKKLRMSDKRLGKLKVQSL